MPAIVRRSSGCPRFCLLIFNEFAAGIKSLVVFFGDKKHNKQIKIFSKSFGMRGMNY